MANITTAKVTLTADKVGLELRALIDAVQGEYNILDSRYTLSKEGDTWTFEGWGTGRWHYTSNLYGYFGRADNWLQGIEHLLEALETAMQERNGRVNFEVVDSDGGMDWISEGEGNLYLTEDGEVAFTYDTLSTTDYTIANIMAAYGETLEAAIGWYEDGAADVFFKSWRDEHGDKEPMAEDFEAWWEEHWNDDDEEKRAF